VAEGAFLAHARYKPVFLKELRALWANGAPGFGFGPGSTLLLDDSVYKTALNPPRTSLHPPEWRVERAGEAAAAAAPGARDDLEVGGALRSLLARAAAAADIREVLAATEAAAHGAAAEAALIVEGAQRAASLASVPGLDRYCAVRRGESAGPVRPGAYAGSTGAGAGGAQPSRDGRGRGARGNAGRGRSRPAGRARGPSEPSDADDDVATLAFLVGATRLA
jgi:hypothetical protein